jgi:hypothetical protein
MKDKCAMAVDALLAHPVRTTFLIALAARLSVALGIFFFRDGSLFQDDLGYLKIVELHHLQTSDEFQNYEGMWNEYISFFWPLGVLFRVFGSVVLAAQVLSALAGAVTAAATVALLKLHVSSRTALLAGLLAALHPSQVLWSSLVLKDAYVWMSLSLLALLTGWWCKRSDVRGFTAGIFGLAALTLYLTHLRPHTLVAACLALILALAWKSETRRLGRLAVASLLLLLMPLIAGVGVAGIDLFRQSASGTGEIRQLGTCWADTQLFGTPVLETETCENYFDPDHVEVALENSTVVDDLYYLPRGLRVMLFDPLPHHLGNSRNMIFPFVEHLLWYPMLLLAVFGLKAIRRDSPELAFVLLLWGGLATMWALVEGNFGTAYRHRGEFVWAAILFAAIGAERLIECRRVRKRRVEDLSVDAGSVRSVGLGDGDAASENPSRAGL